MSPKPITHNISINVTDTDSPVCVRRRIHLRSLSDVTPASRALAPRARSHSDRPRASPAPSPAHAAALSPRAARSERSSPDAASRPHAPRADSPFPPHSPRERARDAVTVVGNPWRKMSEVDLDSAGTRARTLNAMSFDSGSRAADPWVKNSSLRGVGDAPRARAASRGDLAASVDSEPKREAGFKRGKLERRSPVVCESCGNESCECWRPRSPGCPRTPRLARGAVSLGAPAAQCTCEARSPRPSPARLKPRAPPPAADEERPRRLYKSASQRALAAEPEPACAPDPLLETTC